MTAPASADTVLCTTCGNVAALRAKCWRCKGAGRIMADAPDAPRPDVYRPTLREIIDEKVRFDAQEDAAADARDRYADGFAGLEEGDE